MRAIIYTTLGILLLGGAYIAFPRLGSGHSPHHGSGTRTQIAAFRTALDAFASDNGQYPNSLLGLVRQPMGATNWRGPYLDADAIPKDLWGREYIYALPGKQNTNSFELMSLGPDGRPGTQDDIAITQAK